MITKIGIEILPINSSIKKFSKYSSLGTSNLKLAKFPFSYKQNRTFSFWFITFISAAIILLCTSSGGNWLNLTDIHSS